MEADVIYRAKDGRTFTDPLKCEDYEKTLGILKGSVGELVSELEKFNPDSYIFGIVKVRDNKKDTVYCRYTMCLDQYLEDYVNPEMLTEDKRYVICTIGGFLKSLRKENQDAPCQYMILFGDNINLNDSKIMANWNNKVWKQQESEF